MDTAEIRRLIEQEKDPALRKTLLEEFESYQKHKHEDPTPQYDAWEQEAQALITEKIDDPNIRAAIWHHHGRTSYEQSLEKNSDQIDEAEDNCDEIIEPRSQRVKMQHTIVLATLAVVALMFIADYLGKHAS